MCCGQKRTLLATHPSPTPRAIPNFRRSAPVSVSAHTTYLAAAVAAAPRATSAAPETTARAFTDPPAPIAPAESSVRLQYKERSPIQVRGLASGRAYSFSGSLPLQEVDERDAPSLLQTRYFRRI